jgi:hypothetical protein
VKKQKQTKTTTKARAELHRAAELFTARSIIGQPGAGDDLEAAALAFAQAIMMERMS